MQYCSDCLDGSLQAGETLDQTVSRNVFLADPRRSRHFAHRFDPLDCRMDSTRLRRRALLDIILWHVLPKKKNDLLNRLERVESTNHRVTLGVPQIVTMNTFGLSDRSLERGQDCVHASANKGKL